MTLPKSTSTQCDSDVPSRPMRLDALVAQRLDDAVRDRADLALRAARADDERVGERRELAEVEQHDVGRLLVLRELHDPPREVERRDGRSSGPRCRGPGGRPGAGAVDDTGSVTWSGSFRRVRRTARGRRCRRRPRPGRGSARSGRRRPGVAPRYPRSARGARRGTRTGPRGPGTASPTQAASERARSRPAARRRAGRARGSGPARASAGSPASASDERMNHGVGRSRRPRSASSVSTVYDGPGRSSSSAAHRERRVARDRGLDHREPVRRVGDRPVRLEAATPRRGRTGRARGPAPRAPPRRWRDARGGSGRTSRRGSRPSPGTTGAGGATGSAAAPCASPVVLRRLPLQLVRGRSGPCRPAGRRPCAAPRRRRSGRARAGTARRTPRCRSSSGWRAARSRLPRTRNAPSSRSSVKPSPAASSRWTTTPAGSGGAASPSRSGSRSADGRAQRVEALARRRRRSPTTPVPAARIAAAERRPRLARRGEVQLVEHGEHRLVQQRRVVRLELLADDPVVPGRVLAPRRRRRGAAPGSASTWRRNAWPRPGPADAPSMRPGHVGDRRAAGRPRCPGP